jgi:predicted negative regulator of RcsB-dependent stress response
MEPYVTEEQQVEALKKWWKANAGAVIVGVTIGLGVVFGWQYWLGYQKSQAEQASLQYDALTQALEKADFQKVHQQGQILLEQFPDSFYAALTAFKLARLAVEEGNTEAAIQQLQWVVNHTDQEAIKDIARLRLARVLLAAGRNADAQARLDQLTSAKFTSELEELKGDLYLALNEPAKARAAYQNALSAGSSNPLLQMKLDNLPASVASQE